MTARKQQPAEVSAPAILADEAFGNFVTAQRDTAVVEEAALASQKAALIGLFERDLERLHAGFNARIASIDDQLNRQVNIITAADAALVSLAGTGQPSNVVAMAAE